MTIIIITYGDEFSTAVGMRALLSQKLLPLQKIKYVINVGNTLQSCDCNVFSIVKISNPKVIIIM